MNGCAIDMLQRGWEIMQERGIPQVRTEQLIFKDGQVVGACGLGSILLAHNPDITEAEYDAAHLDAICPDLKRRVQRPGYASGRHQDQIVEVIWEMNDGYWYEEGHEDRAITPIPEIIAYLKAQLALSAEISE